MNGRTYWLFGGLAVAALAWWAFVRNRASGAAGDVVQAGADALTEFTVTAQHIGEDIANAIVPRGIRNNNPGNLRYLARNAFNGQVANDGGYGVYDTAANGVRALGHQLAKYARSGLNTVRDLIATWAPPSENNTDAYIADVAAQLGVLPDEPLDVAAVLPDLTAAIIYHENGQQPYDAGDIAQWVNLT